MADQFGDSGFGGFNWDFSYPDFNWDFDFGQFQFPEFDFSQFAFPEMPAFDWGQIDFGNIPSFSMPDPLALPSYNDLMVQGPLGGGQWDRTAFGMPEQMPPMSLSDFGFGGSSAPSMTLPEMGMPQGSDPIPNLMGTQGGLGFDPAMGMDMDQMFGAASPMPGGSDYGIPSSPLPGLGGAGYGQPGQAATGEPSLQDLQRQVLQGQIGQLNKGSQPPSTMDTITKLLAAFGPTALGAAGLGMQAANRPERNPLEDDLLRARISSSGLQDTLARDRLNFERENAGAMMEHQAAMQEALLASRKPGGQANITALLQGNPQLAALYNALTTQTTGLANGGGSPEFNALIDQIAQVDIAELQKQAQQQIAQAQEMAARQGINPANIIAEIQQRVLQESAKARANARATLIQQLQPGINVFNSVGGLFGNLFQTPGA